MCRTIRLHYLKRKILPDLIFLCIYPTIVSLHENVQPIYSVYLANTKKKMYPIFVPCKEKKEEKGKFCLGETRIQVQTVLMGSHLLLYSLVGPHSAQPVIPECLKNKSVISLLLYQRKPRVMIQFRDRHARTETKQKKKDLESHRPRIIP